MSEQLEMFIETKPSPYKVVDANGRPLMIGGIYTYANELEGNYYDGKYALCMGKDCFHFIYDGICVYDNETEVGSAHNMALVEGYGLAYNTIKNEWYIRNSARKNEPDYIIAKGTFDPRYFVESMKKVRRVFMK